MELDISTILDHSWLSLLPFALGLIAGGGLGALCALVARRAVASRPRLRRWLTLLPWRTFLLAFYPITVSPLLFFVIPGSVEPALAHVALTVFLLAIPLTASALWDSWFPASFPVRMVAASRSLGALSFLFATQIVIRFNGDSKGLTLPLVSSLANLKFEQALYWWLALVALVLLFDLVAGAIEFAVARPAPVSLQHLEIAPEK